MIDRKPSLTFTLGLSVREAARDVCEDVLVRGTAEQTVGELALRLAGYLGHPSHDAAGQLLAYGLRVERTGEQLRPDSSIGAVDLLEGDSVILLAPRGAERRRPRWAEPEPLDAEPAGSGGTIIPLRPRRPRA